MASQEEREGKGGGTQGKHVVKTRSPLRLDYLFGLASGVAKNIHYVEEQEVIFPCGHHVVSYDTEKRTQKFMANTTGLSQGITAMATGNGQKGKLLAVAERGDHKTGPSITIYDLETRKKTRPTIFPTDMKSKEIVCMAMSLDGQKLLTLGGAPDWMLINWQWNKGRILQKTKISNPSGAKIYQCSYCPTDPACICITGNQILKFLRVELNEFRAIRLSHGSREPQNYLSHAWVDVRLLVGTDTGEILVFVNAEYRGILDTSPCAGISIHCIATFSKGFVCGCDAAKLYVFERDEKKMYKQTCTLENSQAYVLSISNSDIQMPEDINFEPLALPYHHGAITGLDVCLRKPLVVTCGLDKKKMYRYLSIPIVSLHPSGFHLLVGFVDALRLMNLLMDEIRLCKEFQIRGCHECHFSHGGHLFAAANGSSIHIFRTYTCEEIAFLKGHTGKVTSLYWAEDDSILFSAGIDGSVLQWDVSSNSVLAGHKQKGCNFTCVFPSSKSREMIVVGSDKRIKTISPSGDIVASLKLSAAAAQIVYSPESNLIFGGSIHGSILIYSGSLDEEYTRILCHEGACSRIRTSADGKYLFSVSEDGSMGMFEILENVDDAIETYKSKQDKKEDTRLPWSEDILVSKRALEAKLTMMTDLKSKVEDLQHQNQIQLAERNRSYKTKMKEVERNFNAEFMQDKKRYKELEKSKAKLELEFEKRMATLQSQHEDHIDSLKQHHNQKMRTETERIEDLTDRTKEAKIQWSNILERTRRKHANELRGLTSKNNELFHGTLRKREAEIDAKKLVQKDFSETRKLMEEETDFEFEDLKIKFDSKLVKEQQLTLQLKEQNAKLRRQFNKLQVEIKQNDAKLLTKTQEKEQRKTRIKNLQKDIMNHNKEIEDREFTVHEKEKRIFDLHKKNQELEKFKFVLDYKISELKNQNAPREEQSRSYIKQLSEMKQELFNYENKNAVLKLDVEDYQQKLEGINTSIGKQQEEIKDTLHLKKEIQIGLKELSEIVDIKEMANYVKVIYTRYSDPLAKSGSIGPANASDANKEYMRTRKYLERSVESLKRQIRKDTSQNKRDFERMMRENVVLVREINTLRREYQMNSESLKLKEMRVEEKRKERLARKKERARSERKGVRARGTKGKQAKSVSPKRVVKKTAIKRQIEIQQHQITDLKQQLAELLEKERAQGVGLRAISAPTTKLAPLKAKEEEESGL
ncbi:hypothetical protein AAMO2058_000804800 [Amorphochlora amoebiformis]